jgi:hypothetical protein
MLVLEIIAGWIVLSCVVAPFVGQFMITNVAEREDASLQQASDLAASPTR